MDRKPPSLTPSSFGEHGLVNIEGLFKGAVLAALYNSSPPRAFGRSGGLWFAEPIDPFRGGELFRERGPRFAELGSRWLYVDLSGDSFDATEYDSHVGEGAAEAAIRPLREVGAEAWEFLEVPEKGMDGVPFVRTEAPGALRNDTTVVKVNTGFDDNGPRDLDEKKHLELTGAFDGDRGTVLGSYREVWDENGVPMAPKFIHFVEWDHDPKVVYGVPEPWVVPASSGPDASS